MVNPSTCWIWGLGALNHSFCNFEQNPTPIISKNFFAKDIMITLSYLEVCLGSWLSSARQIMIIQHVEMKLCFGNIGKCKI